MVQKGTPKRRREGSSLHTFSRKIYGLALILTLGLGTQAWAVDTEYCGKFVIRGPEKIGLNGSETFLVCGDKDIAAWDDISTNQALFHFKTFLQDRGYFNVFTRSEASRIVIFLGKKVAVTAWEIRGGPPEMRAGRFRNILGEHVTPALLDNVSERVTRFLQVRGYACPKVRTEMDLTSGVLWTNVAAGKPQIIVRIKSDGIEDLNDRVLRRYDAFQLGILHNQNLLALTENRIMSEKLLQTSHFNVECMEDGVELRQRSVAGRPRLFMFGFGVNTETWLSARSSWKHTRLGTLGSSVEVGLQGSFKSQQFRLLSDWYFSPSLNRFHLQPSLTLKRENEETFQRYTGELFLTPATSWDNSFLGVTANFGPALTFQKTVRGAGSGDATFASFKSLLRVSSHLYELLATAPREGYQVELRSLAAFRGALSPVDAQKFELRFNGLWNFSDYDPPFLILGVRGHLSTTFTPEVTTSTRLPSEFRHFLGGSADMRGFNRLALPSLEGALTSLYMGYEARFPDLLPWGLEPLAFADFGLLGIRPMKFDSDLLWNPGLGLRFASPIGTFRTTVARGFVAGDSASPLNGWKLFLSFGEEF